MSEEEFYSKALSFDEVGMQVDIFEKEKAKYQQQIQELTNNWNELEEWIKNDKEQAMVNFECGRCFNMFDILDKMKEIKEGNNVSDRD